MATILMSFTPAFILCCYHHEYTQSCISTPSPTENSTSAIFVSVSYRGHGKHKKRTLANLSTLPTGTVKLLRLYFKGVLFGLPEVFLRDPVHRNPRTFHRGDQQLAKLFTGTDSGNQMKPLPQPDRLYTFVLLNMRLVNGFSFFNKNVLPVGSSD